MRWGRWTGALVTTPFTAAGWGLFLARDWFTLACALIDTCCWFWCIHIGMRWPR